MSGTVHVDKYMYTVDTRQMYRQIDRQIHNVNISGQFAIAFMYVITLKW